MTKRIISTAFLAVAAMCFVASSARAQIASYVDERGKVIYINEDSPQPHRGSSIKPMAAAAGGQISTDVRSEVVAALAAQSNSAGVNLARPSPQTTDSRLDRIVQDAAQRHSVDPALVKAVISTESGWNTRAISQKGAVGLMQLVPATAQRFGVGNPFDPEQNVEGGTMYLKSLLDRYNGDLSKSLAAYNAGEGAVDANRGVPPYRETRMYVQKVTKAYFRSDLGRSPSPAFTLWSLPRPVVRQELGTNGRIVFTNE
jgi:soluble lytic murein transglycosylase-like protein